MALAFYCNKCGRKMNGFDVVSGVNLTATLGYGSKYDGQDVHIDLCLDCMDELIDQCVISPFNDLSEQFKIQEDE